MVPVLVLLTFAALVALDRLVLSKGYLEEKSGWPARLELLPAARAEERVPDDVVLQPTWTWSRASDRRAGALYLGVHPILLRLVGEPCELELRAEGERVAKGEALLRLGSGAHRLSVRAPVAGCVERVNRAAARARPREVERCGAPWVYRFRPERAESAAWLRGGAALEWTRRQYRELRAFLEDAAPHGLAGPVLADGGELRAGVLAEMDDSVWKRLEDRFLGPVDC